MGSDEQMMCGFIGAVWVPPDCEPGKRSLVEGVIMIARMKEYLARMLLIVVRNTLATERYRSSLIRAIHVLIDRLDRYDNALLQSTPDTINSVLHTIARNCAVSAENWKDFWAALPSATGPETVIQHEIGAAVTRLLRRCSYNIFTAYAHLGRNEARSMR